MVERFTVYPGVTYHTGQPHQNIKGEYVLYSDYASLQKELAERTAGHERYKRSAAKHFADSCHLADRALTAESRADTLARRVEGLEAALRDQFCPRPCNGRPDKFDVGDCVDAGECSCSARAALNQKDGGNG